MKRKIAAILAADIAGYTRLIAEDEEETLRRLASYRAVTAESVARYGGRIFSTPGDAVLAEFPSAVEAVRCAIEVQESLRTRNLAYPVSRQMSFRIGITIGDVVERDGDLLGDGVNIAVRLEGLADVGGICVSRAVHEQVAGKLSVQFTDLGAQDVKNIPTPVHAFMVATHRNDSAPAEPSLKRKGGARSFASLTMVVLAAVVCIVIVVTGATMNLFAARNPAASTAAPSEVIGEGSPFASPPSAALPMSTAEKLTPDAVPFITERSRKALALEYVSAPNYKAIALTNSGINAYVTSQPSEEAARTAAMEQCGKRVENLQPPRHCELYAVGNAVVSAHAHPPMPPTPWLRHDASIETPFAAKDIPLIRDTGRAQIDAHYPVGRTSKAIAIGPHGQFYYLVGQDSVDEAMRRTLEGCGSVTGVPCMIVAVDDVFVVPIPATMKVAGFFRAASDASIASDAKDDVARRLAGAPSGWSAVAVGTAGRPGLALHAPGEQRAVDDSLGDCARHDSDCRVIAIGPFSVKRE